MSDDTPTYLESNKPEAERCVELASAAWQAGDLAKAQRMLAKSLKLYPTRQAQELIRQLTKHIKEQQAQQEEENRYRQQQQQQQEQEARYRQQQQQQQQQRQQQSSGAHQRSNAHQSTPHKSAGTPTGPASPGGANYTGEQSDSARVILARRKDYYAIFQVSRTAEHAEIKTSYRKLALRFHPDKNKAPEAEEAFKVVSNAFQCLSDPQKRAHYDAYGEEEPNGGGGRQRQQYQREDDLSPEDIFNAFFNGGMAGAPRRTYTYRRQAQRPQQQQQEDGPAALFSQFAHFLPLLLLLLFGLMSAPSGEEQLFGLTRSGAFPIQRSTTHAKVEYFVTNQFAQRFARDARAIAQVEQMVEQQAFKKAEEDCNRQKKDVVEEERRAKKEARGADLAAKLQALHSRHLEACERLNRYQTNAHGPARGG